VIAKGRRFEAEEQRGEEGVAETVREREREKRCHQTWTSR